MGAEINGRTILALFRFSVKTNLMDADFGQTVQANPHERFRIVV